jgi:hypothetical protein
MEHDADEMLSEEGSSGLESSDARRAKAQAMALSQAAESARARYARLASSQGRLSKSEHHNEMLANDTEDLVMEQGKRIDRIETALAATTVASQLSSLDAVKNNVVLKTAVPWAPLLFMKPAHRESGVAGFVADPRVWSLVAAAALAAAPPILARTKEIEIAELRISRYDSKLRRGERSKLLADAIDRSGNRVPANITFTSNKPSIARVDADGNVQARRRGKAQITATLDGKSDLVRIRVT